MDKIRAVFISHEHGDHISGVTVLAKKYALPVYITNDTLNHGYLKLLDRSLTVSFRANEPVIIGSLHITPFPKFHDAADPHSFIIEYDRVTVGVFTDIGQVCENVIRYFKQCHAIFLETNYDTSMLEKGSYPFHLKQRIRGGEGHLSNDEALQLFLQHRPPFMSHVFLSHLSKNNNTPESAASLFEKHAGDTKIIIASRYTETPLFYIGNTGDIPPVLKKIVLKKHQLQLSLF
jgi:phosphoribosyl 1,2-cyclic phosphodiesterase